MIYYEAPTYHEYRHPEVFLAGGITGCPDWQAELVELMKDFPITINNPRRGHFPIDDPSAAKEQITWEYRHLKRADLVVFWFPEESICPISLFELGTKLFSLQAMVLGVHENYPRRRDVEIQTELMREDVAARICYSVPSLARQVDMWLKGRLGEVSYPRLA